ncbi:MAG: hypothetical protein QOI04_371 [Verrucomicrobiota bacterium]|jgi:hypothetical protein
MKLVPFVLSSLLLSFATIASADESADKAQQMAADVSKACGGDVWPNIGEIQFTFVVEQDGKTLASAEHKWNLVNNTDEVKWKGKDVTVNLAAPTQDEDGKAAYARWVNDSYWLLAPLKLRDPGVHLSYEGPKSADGTAAETMHAKFDQVGLTPGDQYIFYVEPKTKRIMAWDYIPKADTVMHATWEKYQNFSGLTLATEHKMGDKIIRFTNVRVALK